MSENERGGASGGPPALLHTSRLYQRLEALGLSGHVRCWFLRKLDGSAGGLVVDDRSAFLAALRATGRFCEDSSKGSLLHGGRRSFREWRRGPATPCTSRRQPAITSRSTSTGCRPLPTPRWTDVAAIGAARPRPTSATMSCHSSCIARPRSREQEARAYTPGRHGNRQEGGAGCRSCAERQRRQVACGFRLKATSQGEAVPGRSATRAGRSFAWPAFPFSWALSRGSRTEKTEEAES